MAVYQQIAMAMAARKIGIVRMDIPLRTSCAYFFVDPGQTDAWWRNLYDHLVGLAAEPLQWEHEPVQGVHLARVRLTNQQRSELCEFLRSAPQSEIDSHRTLRRAVKLKPELEKRLELVVFAA